MKKIIGNKLYDTEKAELILNFRRRANVDSILFGKYSRWVDAELYKTKKGNWFEVVGLDVINPTLNLLTEEQAQRIIKVDPEKYQEMYDDVEEA